MSLATLITANGRRWTVLTGTTLFPLRGVWTARIKVDADEGDPLPPGAATLELAPDNAASQDAEPVRFAGTIRAEDMSTFEGRATALLVAGAGTFATLELPAKTYQQAPLPVPVASLVADVAEEAGELTSDLSLALFGLTVIRWHRVGRRTAAQLLSRLAEDLELGWRMGDDGALVVAAEEWPEADLEAAGWFETGPEDAINRTLAGTVGRASLRPGTTVGARRIEEVVYEIDANGLRALLRYGPGDGPGGLRGDVEQQTRAAIPSLAYRELHAATVRRQNLDGTLDLDADDPTIGGITAVPYRPGIVGCRLVIAEGERLRLGFEGGDERAPFATAWDALPMGGKGVARQSDTVRLGSLTFTAAPDTGGGILSIIIAYNPPPGSPNLPTSATLLPDGLPLTVPLGAGVIHTASTEVFIRGNP